MLAQHSTLEPHIVWFVREAPGYGIAAFLPNAPQFSERGEVWRCGGGEEGRCGGGEVWRWEGKEEGRWGRIFIAKGAAIWLYKTATQPSKCNAFCREKAARFTPFFQVPPCHVSCILFDVYRIMNILRDLNMQVMFEHIGFYIGNRNLCYGY